jgi:hypothetical protein
LRLVAVLTATANASAAASAAEKPSGLMVHVPLDGSVIDATRLCAVRPEAAGKPEFVRGADGEAAVPAAGRRRVGRLHVSRLARLVLRGRTPSSGTIMLWVRPTAAPAGGDSSSTTWVLTSDPPLALRVGLAGSPSRLVAAFDDRAGATHETEAPLPAAGEWSHVALGWDAGAGAITAFIQGEPAAQASGPPFKMPGLPKVFELGATGFAIDDFRLYNHLLDREDLHALPGLAAASERR